MLEKIRTGLLALLLLAAVVTPLAPARAAGTCALLYSGENFGGDLYTVEGGADIGELGAAWDDRVSSLRVLPGCRLRVWENAGKKGDHRSYVAERRAREVSWIGEAWNDQISSLTCACREPPPSSRGDR
jgi:hypothetical protein